MPTVQITLLKGRSASQKRELISRITETVHEVAGTPREGVVVILQEVGAEDYGRGGIPIADRAMK